MKLQVLALVVLGCAFHCGVNSLEGEHECPPSQYYDPIAQECKNTGRNAIQVPGRCPDGQSVAANKECVPIWRKPTLPPLPPLKDNNTEDTTEKQPENQE